MYPTADQRSTGVSSDNAGWGQGQGRRWPGKQENKWDKVWKEQEQMRRREEEARRERERELLPVESDAWWFHVAKTPSGAEDLFHLLCGKLNGLWNDNDKNMKVTILTMDDAHTEETLGSERFMVNGALVFVEGEMHSREEVLGMLGISVDSYMRTEDEWGVNELVFDNFIVEPSSWRTYMWVDPVDRLSHDSLMSMIRVDNIN